MGFRETLIADSVLLCTGHVIDGTSIADLSGTQDGSLVGASFWTIQSDNLQRRGIVCQQSGAYGMVPYNSAHAVGAGDMFIAAWIRPTLSIASLQAIMARDESGARDWTFSFGLNSGKLLFQDAGSIYESSAVVTLNSLQHVAVKRIGTALTFYRNGVSVGTGTVSATNYNKTIGTTIGRRNFAGSEIPLTGVVCDPIILPRDITSDELAWISDPTSYWFDISSGGSSRLINGGLVRGQVF